MLNGSIAISAVDMSAEGRPVVWNAGAERDFQRAFSAELQAQIEVALADVAMGQEPDPTMFTFAPHGPPFGSDVWKLKVDERSDTYRVVYVRACPEALYVINAYQKKSRRGRQEPRENVKTTGARLRWAETMHQWHLARLAVERTGKGDKR